MTPPQPGYRSGNMTDNTRASLALPPAYAVNAAPPPPIHQHLPVTPPRIPDRSPERLSASIERRKMAAQESPYHDQHSPARDEFGRGSNHVYSPSRIDSDMDWNPAPNRTSARSQAGQERPLSYYSPERRPPLADRDSRYSTYSRTWDPRISQANIEPDCIDDDDDDPALDKSRARMVPFGAPRDASGHYGPVKMNAMESEDHSDWLRSQTKGRNRLKWLVGIALLLAIVAGVTGGVYGGLKNKGSSADSTPAKVDDGTDLGKDSAQVKKVMNNAALHRIMPGVDYSPYNAQYPDCLSNPPSQNNVTLDVAVLSQLTKTIRLYGTDCNQTEMVLHSISTLGLTDMKVWLAVWLDKNTTTNDRGLATMYDLIDKYGQDPFAGVVIGNEVLFRKDLTTDQVSQILMDVRSKFSAKSITLPIAAADLGDSWTTSGLAQDVDVVMSNIHPFFAGQPADTASAWTWNFWQTNDVSLSTGTSKKHIISEVGWPSGGGTDCGGPDTCTGGSVAGIDGMNTFMDSFICQSLANGTEFFWFEAFDQPWQARLNTPGKEWEDKWGLMDASRKIKNGLKIPDCGGKTV